MRRYTVEQVAWDGPNGLEVGWATMDGPRYDGGEIIDVYAERDMAESVVRYFNTPNPCLSMGEPSDWETA